MLVTSQVSECTSTRKVVTSIPVASGMV